jgi:hypothetical protein
MISKKESDPSDDPSAGDDEGAETSRFKAHDLHELVSMTVRRSKADTMEVLDEDLVAEPPPSPPPPDAAPPSIARFDWRESNLARRPAWFDAAHGTVELLAIVVGFGASTLSLMAVAGLVVDGLVLHAVLATVTALGVPALVARWVHPKDDPLIALGLTAETYSLFLLGFAVAFVIAAHGYTAPLLAAEGDRAARAGAHVVARAAWFLARVQPR